MTDEDLNAEGIEDGSRSKLWTTLASSVLGIVCCLVSSGSQLLLLFQDPVLVLEGLALAGPHTRIVSPKDSQWVKSEKVLMKTKIDLVQV